MLRFYSNVLQCNSYYVYYAHAKFTKAVPNPIQIYMEIHVIRNGKFVSNYAESKYVSE